MLSLNKIKVLVLTMVVVDVIITITNNSINTRSLSILFIYSFIKRFTDVVNNKVLLTE